MSEEQRQVYGRIIASRGNLAGPFAMWLHSPEMADRAQALGEFVRYHTSLPSKDQQSDGKLSEFVILLVARHFNCQAEWSIHEPIALKKGVTAQTIDALRAGQRPADLSHEESILYAFVTQLLATHFVNAETFAETLAAFGAQAVVELTTLVGYYTLVAMTLNVFEVALPPNLPPLLTNCPTFA